MTIINGMNIGEPTSLTGFYADKMVVFGSDGGGDRFAIRRNYLDIIYLPIDSVQSSVFDGNSAAVKYLAKNFDIFLEKFVTDIEAFVYDYSNHTYITDY
jgi:hypothetical protein